MKNKYKVETITVINHNPIGSTIELSEKEAKYFESIGYVRIIGEIKPDKKASAPKKTAKKTESTKPKEK